MTILLRGHFNIFCFLRQNFKDREAYMMSINQAKVIIVGESGAGKTSFVQSLKGTPVKNPPGTVGCALEPVLHLFKAGTPDERACFVELWDVGGSQCHRNSRRIFYNNADGVILVYDLTNKKSLANLSVWYSEVLDNSFSLPASANNKIAFDMEQFLSQEKPLLLVGAKLDSVNPNSVSVRRNQFAVESGAEEIFLNCRQPVSAGSNNRLKIDKFFDKVLTTCHAEDKHVPMASLLLERKRKNV